MSTLPRRVIASLVVVACLTVPWGCQERRQDARRLVLGTPNFAYSGLIVIAKENGYLADQGLDVVIQEFPSGLRATEAMARGEVDLACVADFAFMAPAMRDPSLRVVASIASVDASEILARKDAGVAAPEDLRDKRIGYAADTTAEFYLSEFLLRQGLRESSARLVDVAPGDTADALIDGRVDAVSTWDTLVFAIERRLGDAVLAWPAQGGRDYFWMVATRQEFLQREPRTIEGVLRALLRAETFLRERENEAKALVSRYWGYGPDLADFLWSRFRQSVSLNQALVLSLENAARWRVERGDEQGRPLPNVNDFISYAGLAAVAPGRVTAFR